MNSVTHSINKSIKTDLYSAVCRYVVFIHAEIMYFTV